MWFAWMVPGMLAAVWIWPRLRVTKIWFGLFLLVLVGTTLWLGLDLRQFFATDKPLELGSVRLAYSLFTASDTPVLPLMLGSLLTGLVCLWGNRPYQAPPDHDGCSARSRR